MSTVNINTSNNTVSIQDTNQEISVTDNNKNTTVSIPQTNTNIVQVNTPGPQGIVGPRGERGETGSFPNTGSFATTGSNVFNGNQTINGSLTNGDNTTATGNYSHAEGFSTTATGDWSHAEGDTTTANGFASHAEGIGTTANGDFSHAEGDTTTANGFASHAEGIGTTTNGDYSHAEGDNTQANGNYSHAEGQETKTLESAQYSHAEGYNTIASANWQHVQGQWNATSSIPAAFIVGNGTDNDNRSNLIHAAGNAVQITGTQIITGSSGVLRYSGTDANTDNPGYPSLAEIHANDATPWLERFYNDTFSSSSAIIAYFGWDDGRFVFHNESTQSIGLQVNGYSAENGLLVYEDKVAFVNNVEVTGSLNALSITGSLQGTASFATRAISSSFASTASFSPNYLLLSNTSSMLSPYMLIANTSSMLQPYVLTNITSSMLSPYMLNLSASSFTTTSSFNTFTSSINNKTGSFATTGSNIFIGNQTITGSLTVSSSANTQLLIGTNALFVSGSGNVGIGTATPAYDLDILTPSGDTNYLRVAGNGVSNTNGNITLGNVTGTAGVFAPLLSSKSSNLSFPGMWFIGDGASGTDSGTTPMIRFDGRINNGTVATRPLVGFANVGTDLVTILANGNVGIGTNTPSTKVHIKGTTSGSNTTFRVENMNASGTLTVDDVGTLVTPGRIFFGGNTAGSTWNLNGSAVIQASFGNESGQIELRPNGSQAGIVFSRNGNMGLGSPSFKFFSTPWTIFASGSVIVGDYGGFTNNTAAPARFAVSGSGAQTLVKVDSTTISNILNISSSGAVTISGSLNLNGQTVISTGSVTLMTGSITMPNRPAFRVIGTGGSIAATTTISGSSVTVEYNQGNAYNQTTGKFTAPIAGLYQVNVVCRTAANNNPGINQIIVRKQLSGGGAITAQIMLEWAINTSVNHIGGSTISNLAVGDTLWVDVTAGTISFDGNNNFSAAYIG